MADTKISSLTALTGADTDTAADVLAIVDTSVTTTKKMLVDELAVALAATQAEVNAMTSTNTLITPALNKIILGTEVASTSGTAIDYTGFPTGVRRITIMFSGASTSGNDSWLVQIGDSGGFENTGYSACGSVLDTGVITASSTAGFIIRTANSARVSSGVMTISLENSTAFTWVSSHALMDTAAATAVLVGAGSKSLSAELTQIRITTTGGTNTFDAGVVNISYER